MLTEGQGLLNAEKRSIVNSPMVRSMAIVVAILSIITIAITLSFGIVVLHKVSNVRTVQDNTLNGPTASIPSRFHVPYTSMTPAKDQARRGTCWIFGTLGMVEGSYRKYGYEHGYLAEDEYVTFSEQAYGIGMVKYCLSHPEDKYCFGGPPKNDTADGEPEWLYYMRSGISKFVLPNAVCPYQQHPDGQFLCPGLEAAVEKTPLTFNIKSLETAYTVDSIKRLLWEKQAPLAWSHGVFEKTYVIPCDDTKSSLSNSEQCLKCMHPCTTSKTGCCAELVVPGYTQQGVFAMYGTPYSRGGHSMLVLGWNDEFRVDNGLPGTKGHHTTGGFIIKNSWNTKLGHSVGYWAQDHSIMDENFICPCEASATTWLPAKVDCMLQEKDPKLCCSNEKNVLKEWVKGATVLKCNPRSSSDPARASFLGWSGCRTDMNYVLASADGSVPLTVVPATSDGYLRFKLVEWNPANLTEPAKLVETDDSTWYGIENLLTPIEIKGNSNDCGVFFLPYETFTEGTTVYGIAGHDTPAASFVDIDWDKSSYLKSGKRTSGADYSLIEKSTVHGLPTKFTGPYDFNAQ